MKKAEFEKALDIAIKAARREAKTAELRRLQAAFNAPLLCAYCGFDCSSERHSPEHKLLDAIFSNLSCNQCYGDNSKKRGIKP